MMLPQDSDDSRTSIVVGRKTGKIKDLKTQRVFGYAPTIECPVCRGKSFKTLTDGPSDLFVVICRKCNGTGKLKTNNGAK